MPRKAAVKEPALEEPTLADQVAKAEQEVGDAEQAAFRVRLEKGSAVEEDHAVNKALVRWYQLVLQEEGGSASP